MDAGDRGTHFYIELGYDSIVEGFFTFVRYFQLLSLLLPTSLFVSVEVLKAICSYMIVNDISLISKNRLESTLVRNMSIVEDMGMIHYVFADKTGTLTCNKMEFHSMCIGCTDFGPKELPENLQQRRPSFKKDKSETAGDNSNAGQATENEFDMDRFNRFMSG